VGRKQNSEAAVDSRIETAVDALRRDNRSGASELLGRAIEVLRAARHSGPLALLRVAPALCAAQPSMAAIWNAAGLALRDDGEAALERFARQVAHAPRALARFALSALEPPRRGEAVKIVTCSASGSVRVCLVALAARGPVHVACAEGRPAMEGRDMAAALGAAGLEVTLYTDAAIAAALDHAAAVLVGADAVGPAWIINKAGTDQLAAAAAQRGVPVYVAASRDKFVGPPLDDHLRLRTGPTEEVWSEPPAGVAVANPYFERTPLDLVTALVTDVGVIGARDAAAVCAAMTAQVNARALIGSPESAPPDPDL